MEEQFAGLEREEDVDSDFVFMCFDSLPKHTSINNRLSYATSPLSSPASSLPQRRPKSAVDTHERTGESVLEFSQTPKSE